MKIDFISLFPELLKQALSHSIPSRASKKKLVHFGFINPRDFATDKHRQVDDLAYGGGPGMVLMPEPLVKAIESVKKKNSTLILLSPVGKELNTGAVKRLAKKPHLVLICGRYEGVDERLGQIMPLESYRIGETLVSGGEFPALMLADAVARRLPGAVGNEQSILEESYEKALLDYPHYTRPASFSNIEVPPVLLSGDHAKIRRWRMMQAASMTWRRRPELLGQAVLSLSEQAVLLEALLALKE